MAIEDVIRARQRPRGTPAGTPGQAPMSQPCPKKIQQNQGVGHWDTWDTTNHADPSASAPNVVILPTVHGDSDDAAERAAIVAVDAGAPEDWAILLADLHPDRPPDGIDPWRWRAVLDAAGRLIDDGWAGRAHALGWTAADLFGADRIAPGARVYRNGLVWFLRGGYRLAALDRDGAVLQHYLSGRRVWLRRRGRAAGPPLWDVAARPTDYAGHD